MQLALRGLVAAPHTPFDADTGDLVPARIDEQARRLREDGVVGVFFAGTTGEWPSMTVSERRQLAEAWAAHRDELVLMAHVGHPCQREAVDLARHAASVGVHAVSALVPSFFRPADARAVAAFWAPIAAAAPHLPFYGYHIPGMTGVRVAPDEQIAACLEAIPNFAGMKFTDPDLHAFSRCKARFGGRCELVWGVDELLLSALPHGVEAAVGSTYNYAARIYREILSAWEAGEIERARGLAGRVTRMVDALLEFGVLASGKSLMRALGIDVGPPRPPLSALDAARERELMDRVRAVGALPPLERSVQETLG